MTTHEYVARLNVIDDDKHLGITNRLILMNDLKREYIASLEAENAELIGRIEYIEAKTEKIHNTMYGHGSCNDSAEYVLDNLLLDIVQLNAKNAELERFVEKAIEKLAIRCPPNVVEGNCPKPDNISCTTCWREFLMQSDDATQKELT